MPAPNKSTSPSTTRSTNSAADAVDLHALTPAPQRSTGTLAVAFKLRDGATVLDRMRQQGCLKARRPRPEEGAWTTLVTLNSAGGVAGGDQLNTQVAAASGTQLTITSQAAERYYRADASGQPALVRTTLHVADGAHMEWLPQETILFDQCRMNRTLTIDLAPTATLLAVECLIFGRTRMGETVHRAWLHDTIRLHRGGSLLWQDTTRFDGPVQAVLDRPASAAGGRAVATLLLAAPDAATRLAPLRQALAPYDAGASALDGLLLARIVAADGACARAAIVAGLAALRDSRPLPRLWSC